MFKPFWFGFCVANVVKLQEGAAIWQAEAEPGEQRLCNQAVYWVSPVSKGPAVQRERETDRWRGRQRAERLELDNPAVGVKTYHDSAQGEMGQENDGKSNLHPPV